MWATLTDHLEVVYGAVAAFGIVIALTPAVGGFARRVGAVDVPGTDPRRVHLLPVPRLGGLALFIAIFVPALAFLELTRPMRGLLIGAAVATTVGAIDDFRGLNWWQKLGGQLAAAVIPVAFFSVWIDRFTFPVLGIHSLPMSIGAPLTVLWIVGIMNMVNFLDGLDGLAAGVCAIAGFTFAVIALSLRARTRRSTRRSSSAPASASCATTSTRRASSWATRARCCSASSSPGSPSRAS